jgi:predicted amidophosphoribosyltransferase
MAAMTTNYQLERLRERIVESNESAWDTLCDNCGATLTSTDRTAGYCTQCAEPIPDDVDDESVDEHLFDD